MGLDVVTFVYFCAVQQLELDSVRHSIDYVWPTWGRALQHRGKKSRSAAYVTFYLLTNYHHLCSDLITFQRQPFRNRWWWVGRANAGYVSTFRCKVRTVKIYFYRVQILAELTDRNRNVLIPGFCRNLTSFP